MCTNSVEDYLHTVQYRVLVVVYFLLLARLFCLPGLAAPYNIILVHGYPAGKFYKIKKYKL